MNKFLIGCALTALATSGAYAQSTGSVDFDNSESVVVTGTRANKGVDGILVPEGVKSRAVLTQEFIQNQRPGQTINEIINMLPGVSFQNNDPYGSSGGTLNIRGFDSTRISQTFDGLPLNDTGNYALYSNQQLDPELIEQVNVNLGTTDLDSPTASASGSTVNYRTRNPTEDFHTRVQGSIGEYGFFRIFGVIDTGNLTSAGTRAWVSASHSENYNPYNHNAVIDKNQYNAKIYQPLGSNGDFIALRGHWNENRNNNFSSVPLRTDTTIRATNGTTTPRIVGSGSTNRFPLTKDERDYTLAPCQTDVAQTGVGDVPTGCGTAFDYSFNPSDTGNVALNSRFTLADGLVLTVDPSFQYTKAAGGNGSVKGNETGYTRLATGSVSGLNNLIGYIGGQPYFGRDLNGDTDILDGSTNTTTNTTRGVTVYAPSQTQTNRYGLLASLRYNLNESQTVRINYSFDRGRHRQTGPVTLLNQDGYTSNVFPVDAPLLDVNGNVMQKRNRRAIAMLNQVSGEYRGEFLDDRLTINAGVRAPFFKRELTNFCVTEAGGSFVDCFNGNPAGQAAFLAANPTFIAPISRTFKYNKVLPTGGFNFDFAPKLSFYGSYTKGLQVPGTDNLYQSLGFAAGTSAPSPETTDNFDSGIRYRSSKVQAQLAGWYTRFNNRLASAYDPELDITIYRNLGKVEKYGVDGSIAYAPVPELTFYAFGSYLKSKIEDNVQTGECTAANVTAGLTTGIGTCTAIGQPIFALTAGKRESGAPTFLLGGRIEGNAGPVRLGVQAKRTGKRYLNDVNLPVTQSINVTGQGTTVYQVYGAAAPAYTVVDLDARVSLGFLGLNDATYFQANVTNLFDKLYVAGYSGGLLNTNIPFSYISPPRTFSGTLVIGF